MKEHISKIIAIVFGLIAIGSIVAVFVVRNYLDEEKTRKEQEQQQELLKNQRVTKYSETINVETFIKNFNSHLTDNNEKSLISKDKLSVEKNSYFYNIINDLGFYIIPETFTNSQTTDIVKTSAVFYKKGTKNEELAKKYIKYLFKTNNPEISDEEINNLMNKAIEKSKINQAVDKNNGLFISYDEQDNNVFYIITRNYEKIEKE